MSPKRLRARRRPHKIVHTEQVHKEPTTIEFIDRHLNWFMTGFVILLGLLLLAYASAMGHEGHPGWHDFLRDTGIAILIAAIVGATYETFARSHFIRGTLGAVVGKIFGDIVRDDIWEEVRDRLIRKELIRENMNIILTLPSDFDPKCNPTELWMEILYDLKGLYARPLKKHVAIMHYLDDHIKGENLPRFERIEINGHAYSTHHIREGRFTTFVELENKNGAPTKIAIERRELTYIPGSYNLTMTEMTKGIKLLVSEFPPELEIIVNIRPQVEKVFLEKGHPESFDDIILLPGQNIEFRFKYKDAVKDKPAHHKAEHHHKSSQHIPEDKKR